MSVSAELWRVPWKPFFSLSCGRRKWDRLIFVIFYISQSHDEWGPSKIGRSNLEKSGRKSGLVIGKKSYLHDLRFFQFLPVFLSLSRRSELPSATKMKWWWRWVDEEKQPQTSLLKAHRETERRYIITHRLEGQTNWHHHGQQIKEKNLKIFRKFWRSWRFNLKSKKDTEVELKVENGAWRRLEEVKNRKWKSLKESSYLHTCIEGDLLHFRWGFNSSLSW